VRFLHGLAAQTGKPMKHTTIKLHFLAFFIAFTAAFSNVASAWDGTSTGQVNTIEVYTNGGFVFSLNGVTTFCPQNTWQGVAMVGAGDGAKAMLATLLSAKVAGKSITAYTTNSSNSPCVVGALDIN
jgi:hypothetical protein